MVKIRAYFITKSCLCQLFCVGLQAWECAPRLSPNQQSVLSFRINLGADPEQIRPQSQKVRASRKDRLSARCRVIGICLSRYAPSHPASAPSHSAFLHAAHFLCRIVCLGMGPRLSPSCQSVLSFRTNLRAAPNKPKLYGQALRAERVPQV